MTFLVERDHDDVWELPPLPASEVLDTPEDGPGAPSVKGHWSRDYVANRWHDCSICRGIIGRGDPYRRTAYLESPHGTCAGRFVTVLKVCWGCTPAA